MSSAAKETFGAEKTRKVGIASVFILFLPVFASGAKIRNVDFARNVQVVSSRISS